MLSHPTQYLPLLFPCVESLHLVLPLVVELAVLARGIYTRRPTDIVLGAVAVPCLLVSTWAILEGLGPSGGVYWGGILSVAAGGLLTVFVVIDIVVGFAVEARVDN